MYYQLTCTCGHQHAVTNSQAGQSVLCQCGQTLAIPTLRGLQQLPRIEPQSGKAPEVASAKMGAGRPAIATGLLLAIFFVALPTAIFLAYQRVTMDTSLTEESERAMAFEQLDQADPIVLSDAWHQYSSVALGLPNKPNFYFAQLKRQQLERNLIIAAAVAAASGLAAGALSAGRRR